jgi:hypothetical protein
MMSSQPVPIASPAERAEVANGSAMACFLAGGIGAFAMGAVVFLNEAGVFAAPTLYGPAGGVSGRTTLAAIAWLVAWGALHSRWKGRELAPRRVHLATLILIALGVAGTFPPVWWLL